MIHHGAPEASAGVSEFLGEVRGARVEEYLHTGKRRGAQKHELPGKAMSGLGVGIDDLNRGDAPFGGIVLEALDDTVRP